MSEGGAAVPRRVLRRSRDERIIAGVCGGLARHFGIDPVLLRIAWVALVLAAGSGILLYVVAWILIPEERQGDEVGPAPPRARGRAELLAGAVILLVGVWALLRAVEPHWLSGRYFWPAIVIAIGLALVLRAVARR